MKRRSKILYAFLCLVMLLCVSACHTSKSFTFQIENGEQIKITLDTTDSYDLVQEDGTFAVEKDGDYLLQGYFLSEDGYRQKEELILSVDFIDMKRMVPDEDPMMYVYQHEGKAGSEVDYLFRVEGAETGVIVGSLMSFEEAETAFSLLAFEKVK